MALAAFLICFTAVLSVSVAQIQRNQVADTYEAVFTGVEASDAAALKDLPEFARVGEYYLLGQEHSEQGYNASYVYCDSDMIHIARGQMELVKGICSSPPGARSMRPGITLSPVCASFTWIRH